MVRWVAMQDQIVPIGGGFGSVLESVVLLEKFLDGKDGESFEFTVATICSFHGQSKHIKCFT